MFHNVKEVLMNVDQLESTEASVQSSRYLSPGLFSLHMMAVLQWLEHESPGRAASLLRKTYLKVGGPEINDQILTAWFCGLLVRGYCCQKKAWAALLTGTCPLTTPCQVRHAGDSSRLRSSLDNLKYTVPALCEKLAGFLDARADTLLKSGALTNLPQAALDTELLSGSALGSAGRNTVEEYMSKDAVTKATHCVDGEGCTAVFGIGRTTHG